MKEHLTMRAVQRAVELTYEVPFSLPSWTLQDDVIMPEPTSQDVCSRELVSTLRCEIKRTGRDAQVHRNRALRWDQAQPAVGVDPDVCMLEPAPDVTDQNFKSICIWKPGFAPPRLAIEVVSESTATKDYDEGPQKYAVSGTRELWVFDPYRYGPAQHGGPWVLQVWERGPRDVFRRTFAGDGPAWSDVLKAWLVPADDGVCLRICEDEDGKRPWPTEAECAEKEKQRAKKEKRRAAREKLRADAEKLRADAEKLRADAEKLRADEERDGKSAALARIAELEALLGRSRTQ